MTYYIEPMRQDDVPSGLSAIFFSIIKFRPSELGKAAIPAFLTDLTVN